MEPAARFSFAGQKVVVTGAAAGVGKATAELIVACGGQVIALDLTPVDQPGTTFIPCNLGDKASIDAAIAAIDGPIDALCNIAAVASGSGCADEDIVAINYLGHRRLSEGLLPKLVSGGAIVCVSSGAGMGYLQHLDTLRPFVDVADFDLALQWLRSKPEQNRGYPFSKEAVNLWVKLSARPYAENHGVRINAIAPGLVDTQQLHQSKSGTREQLITMFKSYLNRVSQPAEQAWPIAFLASRAASYVTGQIIEVDGGLSTAIFHTNTTFNN